MNSLQVSVNEIMSSVKEAMNLEETNQGSDLEKFKIYKKYVESMKKAFSILDEDLKSFSEESKIDSFKNIQFNHLQILRTVQNCLERSIIQLSGKNEIKDSIHEYRCSFAGKTSMSGKSALHSLPNMQPIDQMLAEKPINPIDSAKINIQKYVAQTNELLKRPKLSVSEKVSIQLRISRNIEETMSIARKREIQLCRKNTYDLEQLTNKIANDIQHHPFLSSEPSFPLIYKNSQLFNEHILKDSKIYLLIKSQNSPEISCLNFILRFRDSHPIVQFLNKTIEEMITFPVSKETKDIVIEKLKTFNETIENLSKLCCLIINTNHSQQIDSHYPKLQKILIDFIFKNPKFSSFIYNFLFKVYDDELQQYDNNINFIDRLNCYHTLLPEKFQSQPDIISILDSQTTEFTILRKFYNPLEKMEKLCQIITDLMFKIHNKNPNLEIGADELVPCLVYMIVRFKSGEIFLHGKYLEHVMPNDYLGGMEGYLLVSVICAMTFCVSDKFQYHISKS